MKRLIPTCCLAVLLFNLWMPLGASPPRVGLVLSGGGARGGAHVGVLKELERLGVPIDLIVGTSVGAMVGSLYAVGYSADDIELILRRVDWNKLFDDAPDRRLLNFRKKPQADRRLLELTLQDSELRLPTGLQTGQRLSQLLDRFTALPVLEAGNDFDRLTIPFRAVATNILTGEPYVFRAGSLSQAVRASIAVPGLFTPVELDDKLLLDGGLANNLPADVARSLGAEIVIAVDVSTPLRSRKEEIRSLLDILDQAIGIHIEEHKIANRRLADVVITPELEGYSAFDFSQIQAMIPVGTAAAEQSSLEVIEALRKRGLQPSGGPRRPSRLDPATFDIERYQVSNRILRPDRIEVHGSDLDPQLKAEIRQDSRTVTLNRIDRRVSRLYGTDRYQTVHYKLKNEQGATVLAYELEKAPATELGLGIRYDRDFNFTGVAELISRDLRGSRNDLALLALVGNAKLARLELENRSLARRLLISPSAYARSFERNLFVEDTPSGEFEDRRAGIRIAVSRLIGNSAQLEAAYHLDRVDLEGVEGNRRQPVPDSLAGVEVSLDLDTLDQTAFPTTGWQAHLSGDFQASALGGDFGFRRFRTEARSYFPLDSRSTLAIFARWGLTQGDVPFYEEFFTGGSRYFSFAAQPFVGLDRGQLRSRQLVALGLEYRRNWKRFQLGFLERIDWGLKYNAGIFSQESRLLEFRDPLHGFGGGLYLHSRFLGPISLEWGGTSEGDFNTYFSIGHAF